MSGFTVFLAGALVGAALAICVMALCRIAADADEAGSGQ